MNVDPHALMALPAEELGAAARARSVTLRILADREALYADFAAALIAEIRSAADERRACRLIVPVGPRGQYPLFVRRCTAERVDLRHVHLFAMDEYLDWQGRCLPVSHPLSFRGFLRRELLDRLSPELGFEPSRLVFPDPLDLDAYSRQIHALGGIDCCFGGIGVHGHVAFNEPPLSRFHAAGTEAFLASLTRVVPLAPETIVMNATRQTGGDFADFPPMAVTAGMADIRAARRIRLYCDGGGWQRCALRRTVAGPASIAYPASLLQGHPDFEVVADADSAGPAVP